MKILDFESFNENAADRTSKLFPKVKEWIESSYPDLTVRITGTGGFKENAIGIFANKKKHNVCINSSGLISLREGRKNVDGLQWFTWKTFEDLQTKVVPLLLFLGIKVDKEEIEKLAIAAKTGKIEWEFIIPFLPDDIKKKYGGNILTKKLGL